MIEKIDKFVSKILSVSFRFKKASRNIIGKK